MPSIALERSSLFRNASVTAACSASSACSGGTLAGGGFAARPVSDRLLGGQQHLAGEHIVGGGGLLDALTEKCPEEEDGQNQHDAEGESGGRKHELRSQAH